MLREIIKELFRFKFKFIGKYYDVPLLAVSYSYSRRTVIRCIELNIILQYIKKKLTELNRKLESGNETQKTEKPNKERENKIITIIEY